MAGGLDQYLAAWLTRGHIMQVVVDAKAADVVLTDRLGGGFEQKLTQLHPPAKDEKTEGDKDADRKQEASTPRSEFRVTRGLGTLFLVDARSRRVLWSDFEKPGENTETALDRKAKRISDRLRESYVLHP